MLKLRGSTILLSYHSMKHVCVCVCVCVCVWVCVQARRRRTPYADGKTDGAWDPEGLSSALCSVALHRGSYPSWTLAHHFVVLHRLVHGSSG